MAESINLKGMQEQQVMKEPSIDSIEEKNHRHSVQFSNNPSHVQSSQQKAKTQVDYNYSSDDDFDLGVEALDFDKQ